MYGATAGKLGILGMDSTTNQAVCSIQNDKGLFVNEYVYYFLLLNREKIIADSFWWAQPNISKSYIDNFQIPLPPLATQKAIVQHLDTTFASLDSAIDLTQANLDHLEELRQSVLNKAFDVENSDIYITYKWVKLGEIFDVRDWTHDSPKFFTKWFPLITSKNLLPDWLDLNNVKLINQEDYDNINQRSKVDKWDLLFAMIWTIWNPTIVDIEPNFAIKNVALFKPLKWEALMEYLRYFLLSETIINKMQNESRWATQKFVGLSYLRNFQIPLPPLAKQAEIVNYLDTTFAKTNQLKAEYQQKLADLKALKSSILSSAFSN